MAKKEFTAGMIQGVDRLYSRLLEADVELARELLDATYSDYPRPAWNTGELRASGAVYIGGQKIMATPDLPNFQPGPNPYGQYALFGDIASAGRANLDFTGGGAKELKIGKLRQGEGDELPVTVRGIITVIYSAPTAALMHDWDGGFSDDESGPGYISLKLIKFGPQFNQVMRRIFR